MPGSLRYQDPDLRAMLAGEYVLGSLHGQARCRFEALMLTDPTLRHEVQQWAHRLEPLTDELEAVTPPVRIWTAIEQQVGETKKGTQIWNNVVFWRRLGLVAAAATLVLALLIGLPLYQTSTPERIAFLTDNTDQPVWLVSASPRSRTLRIKTLKPMSMPADEVCVLWLVWQDGFSQGVAVLPENKGEMKIPLPKAMKRDPNKAELVVTVETGEDAVTHMQGKVMFKGPWTEL
jgi:anti-sigma-K factor RskA